MNLRAGARLQNIHTGEIVTVVDVGKSSCTFIGDEGECSWNLKLFEKHHSNIIKDEIRVDFSGMNFKRPRV